MTFLESLISGRGSNLPPTIYSTLATPSCMTGTTKRLAIFRSERVEQQIVEDAEDEQVEAPMPRASAKNGHQGELGGSLNGRLAERP